MEGLNGIWENRRDLGKLAGFVITSGIWENWRDLGKL